MTPFLSPSPKATTEICILGCGPSTGVPTLDGNWGLCDPDNPKNRRLRTSVSFTANGQTWLIDAGPDLRHQCLCHGVAKIDGILMTHAHFDHIGGLEEVKPFTYKSLGLPPMPVWADAATLEALQSRLPYAFGVLPHSTHPALLHKDLPDPSSTTPLKGACSGSKPLKNPEGFLAPHLISGPLKAAGLTVIPFRQDHGPTHSLGFRFPRWAYSTDVRGLDEDAFTHLRDLDVWLVDCLGPHPSRGHSFLSRTLFWINRVKPKLAVLIHMGLDMDFFTLTQQLPAGVIPAYDGLRLYV